MSISILQVKDENGNWVPIPAIKGDKGEPGKDGLTPFIGANGNWWIGEIDTGAKAYCNIQIATGSYVGTGTGGADNPNVLTFDFTPKLIYIVSEDYKYRYSDETYEYAYAFIIPGQPVRTLGSKSHIIASGVHSVFSACENNTVSWWGGTSEARLNHNDGQNGVTYHYVAIG